MDRRVVTLGFVTLLAVGVWSLAASQSQGSRKGEQGMSAPRGTEMEWVENPTAYTGRR
jgi:hypothetical protein